MKISLKTILLSSLLLTTSVSYAEVIDYPELNSGIENFSPSPKMNPNEGAVCSVSAPKVGVTLAPNYCDSVDGRERMRELFPPSALNSSVEDSEDGIKTCRYCRPRRDAAKDARGYYILNSADVTAACNRSLAEGILKAPYSVGKALVETGIAAAPYLKLALQGKLSAELNTEFREWLGSAISRNQSLLVRTMREKCKSLHGDDDATCSPSRIFSRVNEFQKGLRGGSSSADPEFSETLIRQTLFAEVENSWRSASSALNAFECLPLDYRTLLACDASGEILGGFVLGLGVNGVAKWRGLSGPIASEVIAVAEEQTVAQRALPRGKSENLFQPSRALPEAKGASQVGRFAVEPMTSAMEKEGMVSKSMISGTGRDGRPIRLKMKTSPTHIVLSDGTERRIGTFYYRSVGTKLDLDMIQVTPAFQQNGIQDLFYSTLLKEYPNTEVIRSNLLIGTNNQKLVESLIKNIEAHPKYDPKTSRPNLSSFEKDRLRATGIELEIPESSELIRYYGKFVEDLQKNSPSDFQALMEKSLEGTPAYKSPSKLGFKRFCGEHRSIFDRVNGITVVHFELCK